MISKVQSEIVRWKRFQVIEDAGRADLILTLEPTAKPRLWIGKGAKATASLKSKGGVVLWTSVKGGDWSMAGYTFPKVGKALVKDLKKFVDRHPAKSNE